MANPLLLWLAGRNLARRAGADDARASRLGLLTAVLGFKPAALVVTQRVAQRDRIVRERRMAATEAPAPTAVTSSDRNPK